MTRIISVYKVLKALSAIMKKTPMMMNLLKAVKLLPCLSSISYFFETKKTTPEQNK